ncbi:MAG: GNAT family N-acetyltransferase [Candidatus Bathyarchaeia archaeon]
MEYDRFQLKDGRTVIFEELKEQDLPELIEVFNSVIKEGLYFHRNEGLPDLETAKRWYQNHIKAGLFYLAARVNSEFIGGATIEPGPGKASHVAYFGIYLKRQFRNMGIGTRLIKRITEIAQRKGFEMIKLTVFQTNQQAFRLYKKFGFREVGRIKGGVKFPDGTYTDEIIMVLNLKT